MQIVVGPTDGNDIWARRGDLVAYRLVMKLGTDVQNERQISLLALEKSGSEFYAKTTLLKISSKCKCNSSTVV